MNIFLINGAKAFAHSQGEYNHTLHQTAVSYLQSQGHALRTLVVEEGYEIAEQVANFAWADVVIYQMPGWWMGAPWTVKKFVDEVLTEGHGTLYANDGRTRSDSSQRYGSGGLLKGKYLMLSVTWNAPEQAFTDPQDFFEGQGVEAVYMPFRKAHEFLDMQALPTFLCCDVMKQPQPQVDAARYQAHLAKVLNPLTANQ